MREISISVSFVTKKDRTLISVSFGLGKRQPELAAKLNNEGTATKQVEFELDPPISNLRSTCIQTNVILSQKFFRVLIPPESGRYHCCLALCNKMDRRTAVNQ